MYIIWTACDVIAKMISFFENISWRDNDGVINSKPIFLKSFCEYQSASQVLCSHDF